MIRSDQPRERNTRTQARHRRDVFWQIAAPMVLAAAGALALMVVVASPARAGQRSTFADVSLIFLVAPAMLGGLILLAVLVGLGVVSVLLVRELPYWMHAAQDFMRRVAAETRSVAGRVTDALTSVRSLSTRAQSLAADLSRWLGAGRRE